MKVRRSGATRKIMMGENLEALADLTPGCATLAYLDPPFNSGRSYDAFVGLTRSANSADSPAFDDKWTWDEMAEATLAHLHELMPSDLCDYFSSLVKLIGTNGLSSYLIWLAPRLYLVHRALTKEGALYLHCDPSSSHYLKQVLDRIAGTGNFQNEIVWRRTHAHSSSHRFGPVHDVILYYTKGSDYVWNPAYTDYESGYIDKYFMHVDDGGKYQTITCTAPGDRTGTRAHYEWRGKLPPPGRHWAWTKDQMEEFEAVGRLVYSVNGVPRLKRYVDDGPGVAIQDIWADIPRLDAHSAERVGYDTQKPVRLLERIISASSNAGDVILDPFCGSGTSLVAAERMGRGWIGMDNSILACSLSLGRVRAEVGTSRIRLEGFPHSTSEAMGLLADSPLGFGIWGAGLLATLPDRRLVSDSLIVGMGRVPGKRKTTQLLSFVPISTSAASPASDIISRTAQAVVLLDVPEMQPQLTSWLSEQFPGKTISVPLQSLTSSESLDYGMAKEIRQINERVSV